MFDTSVIDVAIRLVFCFAAVSLTSMPRTFWFDLLGKLVPWRGADPRPEEGKKP